MFTPLAPEEAGTPHGNDSGSPEPGLFLKRILLLDLEAGKERLHQIGAVLGDRTFLVKGRFHPREALAELDAFAGEALGVLGHNVLDYDLPLLKTFEPPRLALLQKPVIDTLFLSPLAFPENPYHRLVKDYKLVKDSVNDPVADARLAASVFCDQWQSFATLAARGHRDILAFYRFCFDTADENDRAARPPGSTASNLDESKRAPSNPPDSKSSAAGLAGPQPADSAAMRGLGSVFAALSAPPLSAAQAAELLEREIGDRVCRQAFSRHLLPALDDPQERPALAYILAWLRVAGSNSVIPPWVLRRFPSVGHLLRLLRSTPCAESDCAYCRETFDPVGQLKRYFDFSEFRPLPAAPDGGSLQERIVSAGMLDRPLLAILPTGGGKSLCYQLPALSRYARLGHLTVVVSPLQALMKDQVDNLSEKTGTPYAAAINGLLTPPERGEILERVRLGDIALLYVAPEQLRNRSLRDAIGLRTIGSWVFDEAHCLSKWGHDFRTDYLYAARFIREFARDQNQPVAPVACFTATAKRDVRDEILAFFKQELGQELEPFEASVERENLHFEVRSVKKLEKLSVIHELLSERLSLHLDGSAIVYTATRRRAERTAEYLQTQGWTCAAFHGGLNAAAKRTIQESFLAGTLQVIVATNAFGMGIDKGDVRLVLHADIPGSLESYLQEAGRAGRDLQDAECVLLYDESDIETQFQLGALSQLSQKDIAQILRGIRRATRNRSEKIVITTGELLRDEEVETSFDVLDIQADTKVKTAIAWLERSRFLQRDENLTRVFQGKPRIQTIEEAREKISALNLSPAQQSAWLSIFTKIVNAKTDDGLNADRLAELAGIPEPDPGARSGARQSSPPTGSERVIRILHQMSEVGLLDQGILLTAFVRHKTKRPSKQILKEVCDLEEAMLKLMREAEPDAAEVGWTHLSLRLLNQRLKDAGQPSSPEILRGLLKSLSLDGRGLAGSRGSLQYRHVYQDEYRVKLLRSWDALVETAKKRRAVAHVLLDAILSKIDPAEPANAELLVSFSTDDLAAAIRSHLFLAPQIKDPLAAIDRGLLFLHEQKALLLQQGLAVFRQAMSINVFPQSRGRKYTKSDYEPLGHHYRERTFQIHVMNEYARLGVSEISSALELVLAYFTLDRQAFTRKYFPERTEMLDRATGEASFKRIVDDLANPVQMQIVSAGEEANMLVLAGPGSGKTRVVIHRCAYLIRVLRVPPQSILVVTFNHDAALALRRRLFALLGDDARGITVQTYHGIAMRITGTSFAALSERSRDEELPFDALIPDAIRLLKGEEPLGGLQPDEVRDRLLATFRHILVDEYQDIDEAQYELISALAGRTEQDPECRLSILAVGDDDQNIYTFRGANVRFIQRFREDYAARVHSLVENYRATAHLIAGANILISQNRDRMKTEETIRKNSARHGDPPGGRWDKLDPLARGKIQILEAAGRTEQALGLVLEWKRMRTLDPTLDWSDFAVLARTRESLSPIRALCEHYGIPVSWSLSRDKSPPLHRIREIARFLDFLKAHRQELRRASDLEASLHEREDSRDANPWSALLEPLLSEWREETGDAELPVSQLVEWLYEALAERRREQRIGQGVVLSTVHGAKGMEYPHVFILDGDWKRPNDQEAEEEERRVFYVAMTRARETLSLFKRADTFHPHLQALEGDFVLKRKVEQASEAPPPQLFDQRFELLGPKDLYLGFASRSPATDPIHEHLAALKPGTILSAERTFTAIRLNDPAGRPVAMLSQKACREWLPRLATIRRIRVVGMLRRTAEDEAEDFKPFCKCERWEVPWVELVTVAGTAGNLEV